MVGLLLLAALVVGTDQAPARPGSEETPLRTGTAAIRGRVLDGTTEQPVEGVEVKIMEIEMVDGVPVDRLQRTSTETTRASGEFRFTNIAAGSYVIFVTSKTHLAACFGSSRQARGPCSPVIIEDDQEKRDADIFVPPAAIIVGRILDEDGNAVRNASILTSSPDSQTPPGFAKSDENGRFEVGGLATGPLMLTAEFFRGGVEGSVRAYYPGVLDRTGALPLNVEAGTRTTIEMRIPRIVLGEISAVLSGPADFRLEKFVMFQPDVKSVLYLTRQDDVVARVANLRAGRYVIEARATANGRPFAGFARVDVAEGEQNIAIELQESGTLTGRVVAERGGLPPLANVRIAATWMMDGAPVDPSGPDVAPVSADGAFSFPTMFGARLFTLMGLGAEWQVVTVRAGRSDITASEYDVVPGSRTELTITVARR